MSRDSTAPRLMTTVNEATGGWLVWSLDPSLWVPTVDQTPHEATTAEKSQCEKPVSHTVVGLWSGYQHTRLVSRQPDN